jgi:hypothetical protein
MSLFTPENWYWIVGGDTKKLFSSATGAYVSPDDHDYEAWTATGLGPTFIDSETSLLDVLAKSAPNVVMQTPKGLTAYAAAARYKKETGGITVSGIAMPTDRETQAQLSGAYAYVQATPAATIQWKLANGSFASLTAAQIASIATAVAAHVQACFAAEAAIVSQIAAGTLATKAQIDSAFAAVTP